MLQQSLCNENGLKICTRCRAAQYCSKECQVQHWKRHKKCCKMISSSPERRLKYIKAAKDYDSALCLNNECQEDHWRNNSSIKYSTRGESYRIYISRCYYEIRNVLLGKGQYEEALVNYRKALEIYTEIHGGKHSQIAACYEWIGNVLGLSRQI